MDAALLAQDGMVNLLLSMGASPDKIDDDGRSALIFAIQSKCLTTINLLALVTQVKLGWALYFLARYKIEVMTGELRQLVERAAQDREATIMGCSKSPAYDFIVRGGLFYKNPVYDVRRDVSYSPCCPELTKVW